MFFRQLFDPETSTYTYLLADAESREAILIDPVREQVDRDARILHELGFRLVATLETHVHADHVTGAWLLKARLGSDIVYPAASGVHGADRLVGEGDSVGFGRYAVEVRRTPGHTSCSVTYVCQDRSMAFTGDALLIRGSGRTDFQQGDARTLYRAVWDQILSLPDDTLLYPGHDYQGRTATTVAEEKRHNPRLGQDVDEDGFVAIMDSLELAYPKRIDVSLPANRALGRLEGDPEPAARRDDPWVEATRSATGVLHVSPEWVLSYRRHVRLIDVREPGEFDGPLGHLPGAELVPLATLLREARTWDPDEPIVTICRSSGRSDRAAAELGHLGFRKVASMVGGMLALREELAAK